MTGEPAPETLETVAMCPVCSSSSIEPLAVRNLNSRDPALIGKLASAVGGPWFVEQQLGVCAHCGHVFQRVRPSAVGLALLYEHFQATLGKAMPSSDRMLEYVLISNRKDYIEMAATSFRALREWGLTGRGAVLELRTYGGTLAALLHEAGADHVEVGALQEFDAMVAGRMYGLEHSIRFSYADDIARLTTSRGAYDLIVMYEGLTHSRDPRGVLEWIRGHLTESGTAVLFREPDTPEYRRYLPLEVVFNNFHLQLFDRSSLTNAIEAVGGLSVEIVRDYHPGFDRPLYMTAIIRHGLPPGHVPESPERVRAFYLDWIARDSSRLRRAAERLATSLNRRLARLRR